LNRIYLQMEEVKSKVDSFIRKVVDEKGRPETLYKAARHIIEAGGKRLRPYLVCKTCGLVGGVEEQAVPAAATVELLHTFTLIHDDIMDQDTVRRGVETVHKKWNLSTAIIAGDLLFAKVFEVLGMVGLSDLYSCEVKLSILQLLTEAAILICEGQALDMEFEMLSEVSESEYMEMISRKTAALFEVSAKVGGVVGGASDDQLERLGDFGRNAGLAFQIVDDVLGLTADEEELGKPIGSDIREGKKTIIVIHALRNSSEREKAKILEVLGDKKASRHKIGEVIALLKSLGSIEYAMNKAKDYAIKAKSTLQAFRDCREKEDLLSLVDLIVLRRR